MSDGCVEQTIKESSFDLMVKDLGIKHNDCLHYLHSSEEQRSHILSEAKKYGICEDVSNNVARSLIFINKFGVKGLFTGSCVIEDECTLVPYTDWCKMLSVDPIYDNILHEKEGNLEVFNPNEPWEVSHDGEKWFTPESSIPPHYVGLGNKGQHVYQISSGLCVTGYIRNVVPYEFMEGDLVWGKPKNNNPSGIWLFGFYTGTKDGSLVINHQNEQPVECTEIRHTYVDGIAQFPPF